MKLFEKICEWQERAEAIKPPQGSGVERAQGRLAGRAFFPAGLGLQNLAEDQAWPDILVVGHNFGTSAYRRRIEQNSGGSEDKVEESKGSSGRRPTLRSFRSPPHRSVLHDELVHRISEEAAGHVS